MAATKPGSAAGACIAWSSRAGTYTVVWGLYAAIDPQWLFDLAGMAPMGHPAIFATLGMVVGLYGLLYFEGARVPERGWPIAAWGWRGPSWARSALFSSY